jgi:anti-anti-sigma factor
MSFSVDTVGDVTVVAFTNPYVRDDRLIRSLFETIDELKPRPTKILFDFTGVEAFAPYAIGKLIALNASCAEQKIRLVLCQLTPIISEIIDIMALRKRFKIYDTRQEALAALAS